MELQLFSKGKWSIGRPIIAEESPWFKGKEVATSLDYTNPRKALLDHIDEDDKKTYLELWQGSHVSLLPLNQQPHEVYINESGLYSLVLRSNQPRAKSFKRWITGEVLPSIRSCCSQLANLYTAVNERLKNQEQTLSGQRQLLVIHEQMLSAHGGLQNAAACQSPCSTSGSHCLLSI